jgi:hypothetical protein
LESDIVTLNGRVERLEGQVPKPVKLYPIAAEEFAPVHLLSQEERTLLDDFIARVQPKLNRGLTGPGPIDSNGYPDMSGLSGQDLYEWGLWGKLGEALLHGDLEAAAAYRCSLNESLAELTERFFAIDEMRIPSKAEHLTGFHPFSFHREQFRYVKACIQGSIDHDPRSAWTEDERMREWLALVEIYGNLEGA